MSEAHLSVDIHSLSIGAPAVVVVCAETWESEKGQHTDEMP